jgi:hypothetical protein
MRKWTILLGLFVFISGCGQATAPLDATVTGPADASFTIAAPGGGTQLVRPIIFTVKDSLGRLIPEVELDIIVNNAFLVDVDGNNIAQNPPDNDMLFTRTDPSGAVTVAILVPMKTCGAAPIDKTFGSSISASTGFTNVLVKQTWTVTCSAP